MFDSPDIARSHFAEVFEHAQIEWLLEALEPSLQFVPAATDTDMPGGTRIGGMPDLPAGLDWPTPRYPSHLKQIVTRGSPEANEELEQHVALHLPYAFLAQVNLPEAKALGEAAADLPEEGRLIFFYDLIAGPYDTGAWAARVIWDRSPIETLTARPLPEPLTQASHARRQSNAEFDAQIRLEYGEDAQVRSPEAGTPYDGPARPMQLTLALRPPAKEAIELDRFPSLQQELAKQSVDYEATFSDRYSEMFSLRFDPYHDPVNRGHRNQLLGGPLPEQSDPRYEAVVALEYGGQPLSPAQWDLHQADIQAKAREWRMLLQIDVADWMQDDGEGTVYFLIRDADLKARRFDEVIAVYQQT